MLDKLITVDSIMDYFEKQVQEKQIIDPSLWIEGAQKVNVLLGDEEDKLYELQQVLAKIKYNYLLQDPKQNVSRAKLLTETTDAYREVHQLSAKIKRVQEFIRIAKIQARLRQDEKELV